MLNVWSVSGERLLTLPSEDLTDVRDLKRRISSVCGLPRYRQRLMHEGASLEDPAADLGSLVDVQLLKLPFAEVSPFDIFQFLQQVERGHVSQIEEVLQRPQDPDLPDRNGQTLLHHVCRLGDAGAVELVLEAGADRDFTDNQGRSAIHYASAYGMPTEVLRLLLEAQASVDLRDNKGYSALHIAAIDSNREAFRLLPGGWGQQGRG